MNEYSNPDSKISHLFIFFVIQGVARVEDVMMDHAKAFNKFVPVPQDADDVGSIDHAAEWTWKQAEDLEEGQVLEFSSHYEKNYMGLDPSAADYEKVGCCVGACSWACCPFPAVVVHHHVTHCSVRLWR